MNELERTELERLVAATGPAGPSEELDARVRQTLLCLDDRRRNDGDRPPRRRLALAFAASVIAATGIGFLGGRLTAVSNDTDLDAVHGYANSTEIASNVTTVPLEDEQVASLLHPRSREGLLGAGPVTVKISNVP
jgi:hypothetical protein